MLLEMFVNELSFLTPAPDIGSGHDLARKFVLIMKESASRGVQRTVHLPDNFYSLSIAPDYNWYNWLGDNRVEREFRQYFKSLTTKVPFLNDDPLLANEWKDIDCYFRGEKSLGLKAAHVADGLALSIISALDWDTHAISCEVHEIIGNEFSTRNEAIHHASSVKHLELLRIWIQQRIQTSIGSGEELWNKAFEFFPNIKYCARVEGQMRSLPVQSLAGITRGLFYLNTYCLKWKSGAFNPDEMECIVSPESQKTLQLYGAEHTFKCPDSQDRIFSWHVKVGKWRIYFTIELGPGQLLVGHVGEHLPTAKFH